MVPRCPCCAVCCALGFWCLGRSCKLCCSQRFHYIVHTLRDWGSVLRGRVSLMLSSTLIRGGPIFAWRSMGLLIRAPRWSYPWMWLLHVQPHFSNELLEVLVRSGYPWTQVISGIRERLNCQVSCMLAWVPWQLCAYVGLWRPGWTRCLISLSWGWSEYYCCCTCIILIDTYWPCLRLQGISCKVCGYLPFVVDNIGEHCVGALCQWCHWQFLLSY